ncbi:MAG: hypothetical protein LQ341_004477 [Variospora aurantia]|nr:MAG: hypothetical protein LQ341_004477 [Variospora aurantia]
MPRLTRAAMRAQPSHDDSAVAAAVALPATPPVTKRTPLGEISGNQEELPTSVEDPEQILKTNKGPGKGRKGKGTKKSKGQDESGKNGKAASVLPDEIESETSSAVDDACQDLLKEQHEGTSQVVTHDSPESPPSPAVAAVTEQLASTASLEYPATSVSDELVNIDRTLEEMQAIPLPSEPTQDHPAVSDQMPNQSDARLNDAELNDIDKSHGDTTSPERTSPPAKAVLRLEDSIEAIDQFEDEMEKVDGLIPVVETIVQNPKVSRKRDRTATTVKSQKSSHESIAPKARNFAISRRTGTSMKPDGVAIPGATIQGSISQKPQAIKTDLKPRQVSDSSMASDKTPATVKKRVSSVHKAPFVPVKSTKPPTRSNFELPGDAVARKLKEAREERMKREKEEAEKKPVFKARPVRVSQAPLVKATATSKARISMARGEIPAVAAGKEMSPYLKVTPRPRIVTNSGKRLSTLSVNKRPAAVPVNSSSRVSCGPPPSMVRQSINSADAAQLKAKGKEVFNRGQIEHDEREKMRKEKEEAAKKARADAAERGRIASRQWAEKQKARKVAEKKVKEGMAANVEASPPTA